MLSQREATFNAVSAVVTFDNGDKVTLTTDEKAQVVAILCAGFEAHEVTMSERAQAKYLGNSKELKNYVGGLVNNWMRKDIRLNGGSKYVAKNPGSRAGSGDSIVKNLKALKSTISDSDKLAEIDHAIQARQAELQAARAKTIEVDYSTIDPDLLAKLGINPED